MHIVILSKFSIEKIYKMCQFTSTSYVSLWCSGSVRDSEPIDLGFASRNGFH